MPAMTAKGRYDFNKMSLNRQYVKALTDLKIYWSFLTSIKGWPYWCYKCELPTSTSTGMMHTVSEKKKHGKNILPVRLQGKNILFDTSHKCHESDVNFATFLIVAQQ